MFPLPIRGRAASAAALSAVALFVAACGGSSQTSTGYGGSAATGSSSPAPAGKAMLATASGTLGTYLTDRSGRALYLWVADNHGSSVCSGACAQAWPPLLTKGKPAVSGAAQASDVGTFMRSDGNIQVTYKHHPLYYFIGDTGAGKTTGQGNDGFGAKWWLVDSAGAAITKAASSGTSSTY